MPHLHVVFDRDGTLIQHVPYLCDPDQVTLLPGVAQGLATLKNAGFSLYLHTNQSGVGRGYFSIEDAEACNSAMLDLIGLGSGLFAEICIAPEHPESDPVYRKPSPAWGQALMKRYEITRNDLCYVGDNVTDLLTAKNLGCLGIGMNTGVKDLKDSMKAECIDETFPVVQNFEDAVDYLLRKRNRNG